MFFLLFNLVSVHDLTAFIFHDGWEVCDLAGFLGGVLRGVFTAVAVSVSLPIQSALGKERYKPP